MSASERFPIISGNWKMNLNHFEAIQFIQKLAYLVSKEDFQATEVTIHPPFTDIRSVQTLLDADKLHFVLGAQNCHADDKGAFTGEVAAPFLAKMNVKYVICGHSERRQIFGETDEMIKDKVAAVQKHAMTPILCVGETLEERQSGQTLGRVLGQMRSALDKRSPEQVASMVIAYEPIWAIGTGLTASSVEAQEVIGAIRQEVSVLSGRESGAAVRLQYGGSVKASNIAEIMAQPDIDGVLVGGASLDPDEFARIVQYRLHDERIG